MGAKMGAIMGANVGAKMGAIMGANVGAKRGAIMGAIMGAIVEVSIYFLSFLSMYHNIKVIENEV